MYTQRKFVLKYATETAKKMFLDVSMKVEHSEKITTCVILFKLYIKYFTAFHN